MPNSRFERPGGVSVPSAKAKGSAKGAARKAGFDAEEKDAIQQALREKQGAGEGEAAVLARIRSMEEPDRSMAMRFHEIVKANAPHLVPRTFYGMPAYAKDGKVVCFFKDAKKFKARYANVGFTDKANLDDGNLWPDSYALLKLTKAEEAHLASLVRKAVS